MTIPTRPAPLPPSSTLQISRNTVLSAASGNTRKEAPPRPPPPRIKSEAHKPSNILSNLFGSKNGSKSFDKPKLASQNRLPPKLPAPPSTSKPNSHCLPKKNFDVFNIDSREGDTQLINFEDSPPPPQPTIMRSNTGSDSVSIDSFSSSTSSPHNFGATSQAESGFEDDFNVSDFKLVSNTTSRSTTFSSDPFECLDDFEPFKEINSGTTIPNIRSVKPAIHPKPTLESSSFYLSSNLTKSAVESFDTKSVAGKNLSKPATNSMPTIIKPVVANKSKALLFEAQRNSSAENARRSDDMSDNVFSLPMPTIPAPQLPSLENHEVDEDGPSYAVVLYDFESDVVEDLNLKVNEKVYLIKQMNEEWIFGRNKRGCEGIFPVSYVDIRVPLKLEPDSGTASRSSSVSPAIGIRVRAIYTFNAETNEDLTIKENEMVNVLSQINSEWLYGSNESGDCGQFPANFLEYIPLNLPQIPTK